ncbi:hypothetical protein Tco_0207534, partial [Tanacetum coccineum]
PGASGNTFRDLNVPYEGHEEYETPRADLLFPLDEAKKSEMTAENVVRKRR